MNPDDLFSTGSSGCFLVEKSVNYIFRLRSVGLRDFGNVAKGDIIFPAGLSEDPHASIMGIYGQNSTGKSMLVKALVLLKKISDAEDVFEVNERFASYISSGKNISKFKFEFEYSTVDYNPAGVLQFDFSMEKNGKDMYICNEKLNIKNSSGEEFSLKLGKRTPCADISSFVKEFFIPQSVEDCEMELEAIRVEAKKNHKSFVLTSCNVLHKLNREYGLNDSGLGYYGEVLNSFCNYLKNNVYIFWDDFSAELRLSFSSHIVYINSNINNTSRMLLDTKSGIVSVEEDAIGEVDLIALVNELENALSALIPNCRLSLEKISEGKYYLNSSHDDYVVNFKDESYGFRKLLILAMHLKRLFLDPAYCVVLDEFDEGIFEYLFGEILGAVKDQGLGQLIFTAHNLRPLEVLSKNELVFSTSNSNNRYWSLRNVKPQRNLRDVYLRIAYLGGQKEQLYEDVSDSTLKLYFKRAGGKLFNE